CCSFIHLSGVQVDIRLSIPNDAVGLFVVVDYATAEFVGHIHSPDAEKDCGQDDKPEKACAGLTVALGAFFIAVAAAHLTASRRVLAGLISQAKRRASSAISRSICWLPGSMSDLICRSS